MNMKYWAIQYTMVYRRIIKISVNVQDETSLSMKGSIRTTCTDFRTANANKMFRSKSAEEVPWYS